MTAAESHSAELRVHNLLDVGQKYMKFLIEKGTASEPAGGSGRQARDP